jgi:superfamily II DNA/RNA helicase
MGYYNNNNRSRYHGSNYSRPRNYSHRGRQLPHYDPALFIKKATQEQAIDYQAKNNFSDFNIDSRLLANILARGYTVPTPIQDQAIPALLTGRDVVGCANTGTGKTAAFLVPLIDKILKNRQEKVLIIIPTRELAIQIRAELQEFSRGLSISSVLCIGGVNINPQIRALQNRPEFVIGTVGRLNDLSRRHQLSFSDYHSIVLDEVDRMLDMGFVRDIRQIIAKLPESRHSLFFSATMPEKVNQIMRDFLHDPIFIKIKTQPFSASVDQDILRLNGKNKVEALADLLQGRSFQKVLVFGRTKRGAEQLSVALRKKGVEVAVIHGNKSQNQRQRAIEMFKEDRVQVLVATDVASRGLDINDITHVINYDLPESYDDYIHRIGRTGRANKKGSAITFVD